jgi:signal transduction histidine kinase
MRDSHTEAFPTTSNVHLLLSYVANLELEVDRLRKQEQFLQQRGQAAVERIRCLCAGASTPGRDPRDALAEAGRAAEELGAVLRDLQEPPGYHPAHDQVIAIAVRPLAEQVFRWQQRLEDAPAVVLRLELESEYVEWFPARLRHILDNLFSNALKYRDPAKAESWVRLGLRVSPASYELRVSDNGVGLPSGGPGRVFELFHRAASRPRPGSGTRDGPGVGLAVVKMLAEQSGGTLTVDSAEGQGTTFVAVLPRYAVEDYLE